MTDFILIIIFLVLLYFYVKTLVRIKAQNKEINYLYKYRDTLLKNVSKYNLPKDLFTKERVEEIKKESYNKGVEDAIHKAIGICDEAIENDFFGGQVSQPSELLHCPFCGSDGEIVMVGAEYYPKCSGNNKKQSGYCYASRYPVKDNDGFRYKKDAIEIWNKRAS